MIILIGVPGTAVWLGVVQGESPCILCWAQRTSMVLIALVGLFVLRYGPRPRYLGMAVLLGAWGVFMGLRHSALHLARDVGQGFAAPIFGVHTYVWAWVVHWIALAVIGVLLLLLRDASAETWGREPNRTGRFAMGLFIVVVAANALQAFVSTGPPPFIGQADPVRFSLNPQHWVWSLEELSGRVSLRGAWTIPEPDPAAVDPDPTRGPLANLPSLPVLGWERIGASLNGGLSDLTRDPKSGRFLAVTDRHGVYLLDSTLSRVLNYVLLDHGFSLDLSPLAGAAFVGSDTLAVLSTNKSYVLLRPETGADADLQWRRFLKTDGRVTELRRSRFATVRARQMYVMSLAYDPTADELITVAVPSPRHRRLVVSRFARSDFLLASEFEPRLRTGLALSGPDRSLAEYVVTAAVVADGLLYALSAAYSTLLVIDLRDRMLRAAYAVPGLEHPTGLASRGTHLLVAQADGRIAVLARPAP
ncbi:MAG: disulfide bond formation protein B [Gemmatimonadetes bacterium]|nr:disulfide bond formation protein B [Gemmatimonadota bacterium]